MPALAHAHTITETLTENELRDELVAASAVRPGGVLEAYAATAGANDDDSEDAAPSRMLIDWHDDVGFELSWPGCRVWGRFVAQRGAHAVE